jgi:hypothetical protein
MSVVISNQCFAGTGIKNLEEASALNHCGYAEVVLSRTNAPTRIHVLDGRSLSTQAALEKSNKKRLKQTVLLLKQNNNLIRKSFFSLSRMSDFLNIKFLSLERSYFDRSLTIVLP